MQTIPLTGADCFLRAFDGEVRRSAGTSHNSQLVLRLGPGFDPEAFRSLIDEVTRAHPILHAPIGRRRGIAEPVYRCDEARPETAPQVEVHDRAGSPGALPELFQKRLNQPFDGSRGRLVHFDVVAYDAGRQGSDFAMTWLHMLFDGAGCEWFVRWLDACGRGVCRIDDLPPHELDPAPGLVEGLSAAERGHRAREWQKTMTVLGDAPLHSLAGPLRRTRQDLHYDVGVLDPEQTARVQRRAAARAGFLTPMVFYLAATLRAHDAVFRARGAEPGSFVVPLPVNTRPRGPEEAMFRTRVSMIWFRVFQDQLKDFDALLVELRRQKVAAVRAGLVEDGVIAMDFARYAPTRIYTYLARRSLAGELCSFFFAYTGPFAGGQLSEFFGAPIRNAFTAPSVPTSPGSAAVISSFGDRMNLAHVHQRGVFSDAELTVFREQLRSDLVGEADG